jgi:hypothetical protein
VSEPAPPERELPRVKARLPFEQRPFGDAAKRGALSIYAVLTLGLAGLALYMALVAGRPLTSAHVAGPAIGALWFGLRVFMIWGSRSP